MMSPAWDRGIWCGCRCACWVCWCKALDDRHGSSRDRHVLGTFQYPTRHLLMILQSLRFSDIGLRLVLKEIASMLQHWRCNNLSPWMTNILKYNSMAPRAGPEDKKIAGGSFIVTGRGDRQLWASLSARWALNSYWIRLWGCPAT